MTDVVFEGWAVLELMGHRQRAGYVKDVEMFGGKMLRIDFDVQGTPVTEFYGCAALYAVRPCTEAVAREHARRSYDDPRPVRQLDFQPVDAEIRREPDPTDPDDDGLPF